MQTHHRRSLSPTRDELAELLTVVDPNPPELPEEVVDLLRRARRYCRDLTKALPDDEYYCIRYQCGDFEEVIDELLQKYNYSMPAGRFDYWQYEWFWDTYGGRRSSC